MKALPLNIGSSKRHTCALWFNEAIDLQQQRRHDDALRICQKILGLDPRFIDAHMMQGVICAQHQRYEEAATHFKRICELEPAHQGARYNLGLMWLNAGHVNEAERVFRHVLALDGQHIACMNSLGVLLAQTGRIEAAMTCFRSSLQLAPAQPEVLNNLGNCSLESKQFQDAEQFYLQAIHLDPTHLDARFNLAKLEGQLQKTQEAIQRYLELLRIAPAFGPARVNLSKILIEETRTKEALDLLREGVAHAPLDAVMWFSLGVALKESENHAAALEAFDRALDLNPMDLSARVNRAASLRELNRLDEAFAEIKQAETASDPETLSIMWSLYATLYEDAHREDRVEEAFQKALEFDPQNIKPKMNYGVWLLKRERFREAWPLYQFRHHIKASRPIRWMDGVPVWTQGPATGRLLIIGEQGVGDQVFHSKFLRALRSTHTHVACVTVDDRLLAAYQRSFPGMRFLAQSKRPELQPADFDMQMGMADLAALLSLDPASDPQIRPPTLTIDPARPSFLPALGRSKPIVGLSWKSANAKNSADKSMSLMELMTGLKDLDVEWVNLQYGDVKDDIAAIAAHLGIAIRSIPELDIFHDLEGLMHLIHECDFVVSSSNSTAHFAGALGKSGAVIVPFNKGKLWYWHMNDGPSPWYPSLNIIHCQAQNDWSGAISDVNQLIRKHLGTSH